MAQWKWGCEEVGRDSCLANKGVASKDGHPPAPVGGSLEKTNTTSSRQQNNRTTLLLMHACTPTHTHTQTPMPSRKMNAQIKIWVGNRPGAMGPVPLASLQPPRAAPPSRLREPGACGGKATIWRRVLPEPLSPDPAGKGSL